MAWAAPVFPGELNPKDTEEDVEKVFNVDDLTKVPHPKLIPSPEGNINGESGEVEVEFTITKEGKAKKVKILKSTDESLTKMVLRSIGDWQFDPGEIDGSPVNCRVRITIPFNLE